MSVSRLYKELRATHQKDLMPLVLSFKEHELEKIDMTEEGKL